jgi:hypothetical protein
MGKHRAQARGHAHAGVGGGGRFRRIPFGRDPKRLAGVGPCRRVHVELADDAPLLGEGPKRSVLALRLGRCDEGAQHVGEFATGFDPGFALTVAVTFRHHPRIDLDDIVLDGEKRRPCAHCALFRDAYHRFAGVTRRQPGEAAERHRWIEVAIERRDVDDDVIECAERRGLLEPIDGIGAEQNLFALDPFGRQQRGEERRVVLAVAETARKNRAGVVGDVASAAEIDRMFRDTQLKMASACARTSPLSLVISSASCLSAGVTIALAFACS